LAMVKLWGTVEAKKPESMAALERRFCPAITTAVRPPRAPVVMELI